MLLHVLFSTIADAAMSSDSDTVTGTAAGIANRAVDRGLSSEYASLIVVPIVAVGLWCVYWWLGGGKTREENKVTFAELQSNSMTCAKEIVQIHERITMRSPAEYQDVIAQHRKAPDRSPTIRMGKPG